MQRVLVEQLKRLYEEAEAHKLSCWAVLTELEDEMEWSGELTQEEKTLDAEASYDGKVLKIVINDLLPRGCNVKSGMMRAYWIRNIIRAVKRLNTPVSFEKALCVIKMFIPRVGEWDVDNFPVVIKTFADGQLLRVELWAAGLPEGDYRAAFFIGNAVYVAGNGLKEAGGVPFNEKGRVYVAARDFARTLDASEPEVLSRVRAVYRDNTAFVPVRDAAVAFGRSVFWDNRSRAVLVL